MLNMEWYVRPVIVAKRIAWTRHEASADHPGGDGGLSGQHYCADHSYVLAAASPISYHMLGSLVTSHTQLHIHH